MGWFSKDKITTAFKKFGINLNLQTNTAAINTEHISTIQTCTRILVENVSRLPIVVRNKNGQIQDNHNISRLFNRKFTNYISSDSGRKLIERDRITNGNGFIRIQYDHKGNITQLIPYPYESVVGIALSGGSLYYSVDHSLNPFVEWSNKVTINGEEILHFKTAIQDTYLGVSPIKSLLFEAGIRQKAATTIQNFYENNAMSPVVLSSSINDLSQVNALKEFTESFELDNAGASNAGKVIKLPPGMKLDALNYKLIDADIINTLKFTNSEIISAFGIPSFLMSYETTQSIENQTLEFKTFALNSILASYKNEIEMKMLTSSEIEQGFYIDFDYSVLLDADLTTKTQAYQQLVTNGLCTHNEAIVRLGFKSIDSENAEKHYLQMQYTPLENRETNKIENNE